MSAWPSGVPGPVHAFPAALGPAPADRDHRRRVLPVVHGGRDRVDEAPAGVGREVDGDPHGGSDGADDLDVEEDLAVGPARVARRRVAATVDAHGDDGRNGQPETTGVNDPVTAAGSAMRKCGFACGRSSSPSTPSTSGCRSAGSEIGPVRPRYSPSAWA